MKFSLLSVLCISSSALAAFPRGFEFSSSLLLPRANNAVSEDGNCGSNSDINATCLGSEFGNCCSVKGYCGKTSAYCDEGCQSSFGKCGSKSDGQLVSTSGSCGITSSGNNVTCQGSEFGNCCSAKGYCGKIDTYCGDGCQIGFGTCSSGDNSSSATTATHKTATLIPTSSTDHVTSADSTSTLEAISSTSTLEAISSTNNNASVDSTTASEAASSTDVDSPSPSTVSSSAGTKTGIMVGFVISQIGAIGLLAWL